MPPAARGGRIGVLIVNLGTPDATDAASVRRYLREFLSDAPRDREPGPDLEVRAQRHHPAAPAARQRPRLRENLESRAQRIAAEDHHPRAGRRSSARRSTRSIRAIMVDWAMRYGNPSLDIAHRGAGQGRLRAHPAAAALSAICRGDHRDRLRRGLRDADRRCATSRRCASCRRITTIRSISRRWRPRSRPSCKRLPFKPELILASFHGIPKSYVDEGDPYPRIARRPCGCCASGSARRQQADADVPVALRPSRMAAALHRQDRGGAGAARREEPRGGDAGIFRRLPGDAGGDRGRERATSSRRTAARTSPRSRASTTARRAWR